jgi:hypothetical protein
MANGLIFEQVMQPASIIIIYRINGPVYFLVAAKTLIHFSQRRI